jgi:hypothetical protein
LNYEERIKQENENKRQILSVCPNANNQSGIYIMTRYENGFKYCYVGQAKHLLDRLQSHLSSFQHIDLSIKKHKLYSEDNPTGWKIGCLFFPESELNEKEQYYIKLYANNGYQMRNKTSGSQGVCKKILGEQQERKGYYDGIAQGEKKTKAKLKEYFDKYLEVSVKPPTSKIKERKLLEFLNNFCDND